MSNKILIAVPAALALGLLSTGSTFASDRDEDGNSASQATIDLREWHHGFGQAAAGNGAHAYGFATRRPHRIHR